MAVVGSSEARLHPRVFASLSKNEQGTTGDVEGGVPVHVHQSVIIQTLRLRTHSRSSQCRK